MKYIIDRIEGDFAVCEDESLTMVNIPTALLPKEIKEGTYIIFEEGVYTIIDDNSDRQERIKDLMDDLWN